MLHDDGLVVVLHIKVQRHVGRADQAQRAMTARPLWLGDGIKPDLPQYPIASLLSLHHIASIIIAVQDDYSEWACRRQAIHEPR